jgi:hypothetical protein
VEMRLRWQDRGKWGTCGGSGMENQGRPPPGQWVRVVSYFAFPLSSLHWYRSGLLSPPVTNEKVVSCAKSRMAYGPGNILCAGGPGGLQRGITQTAIFREPCIEISHTGFL